MKPQQYSPDFRDDDVARLWREQTAKIIDVGQPPKRVRKPMSQWTFKESMCALFALLVIGMVLPLVILSCGLMALGIWDSIHR